MRVRERCGVCIYVSEKEREREKENSKTLFYKRERERTRKLETQTDRQTDKTEHFNTKRFLGCLSTALS